MKKFEIIPHYRSNQIKIVFEYLQFNVATASMTAKATGVPQKNICRYKRELERNGKLLQVIKLPCRETGFKAWYLTTNPTMHKLHNQLQLF